VSFGPPGPSWWSSRPGIVTSFAGFAAGLLVGGLLGVLVAGTEVPWSIADDAHQPTVVAGVIQTPATGDVNGPLFALPLHNSGDASLEVTGIRFDDLDIELAEVPHPVVPAGEWGLVRFHAPPDCFLGVPERLESVRLHGRTADGALAQELPLAEGGRNLLDYHEAMCAPQVMPQAKDLTGAWVLEEAFGEQDLVGVMVLRFRSDGSFIADPEGLAFLHVEHGVEGRYSLRGRRLRVDVQGGYACAPGDRAIWRPSLVDGPVTDAVGERPPLMTLAWLSGQCPDDTDGQIWTLRRVLKGPR
jgi:hypothetical protein